MSIINNSDEDAVLIVGGERSRLVNQYWYPFHPKYNKEIGEGYWADHPMHKLGPHDGMPDALRARVPKRLQGDRGQGERGGALSGQDQEEEMKRFYKERFRRRRRTAVLLDGQP